LYPEWRAIAAGAGSEFGCGFPTRHDGGWLLLALLDWRRGKRLPKGFVQTLIMSEPLPEAGGSDAVMDLTGVISQIAVSGQCTSG
jgi:hypothetical protein